jgi:hypothetical protein
MKEKGRDNENKSEGEMEICSLSNERPPQMNGNINGIRGVHTLRFGRKSGPREGYDVLLPQKQRFCPSTTEKAKGKKGKRESENMRED